MLRLCKMFLVCLALAGLPLQAVAAAGLAFCTPDQQGHGHAHVGAHDHAFHGTDHSYSPLPGAGGEKVLCHHCTAAALPAPLPQIGTVAAAHHTPRPAPHLFLFFPEQPQRPPLA